MNNEKYRIKIAEEIKKTEKRLEKLKKLSRKMAMDLNFIPKELDRPDLDALKEDVENS